MGWTYYNKPPIGWPIDGGHSLSDFFSYWLMNEGSGDRILDLSGNGFTGSLVNDVTWVAGKHGSALRFGGSDDYVILYGTGSGEANPLELNDSFSIIAGIYPTANNSCYLINNYTGVAPYTGQHINFHFDPSGAGITMEGHIDDNVNPTAIVSSEIPINQRHQVALVRAKGSTVKIYIDGIENKSEIDVTTGSVLSSRSWTFGTRSNSIGLEEYNGVIDYILFYNRALSVSEFALLNREPFCMFNDPDEIPVLDQYYTVSAGGIMTPNAGYWGSI